MAAEAQISDQLNVVLVQAELDIDDIRPSLNSGCGYSLLRGRRGEDMVRATEDNAGFYDPANTRRARNRRRSNGMIRRKKIPMRSRFGYQPNRIAMQLTPCLSHLF